MEITNIEVFLEYLSSVRKRTSRVINCIPDDKMNWRPNPSAFSFGDILRHIGGMEYDVWAQAAQFKPSTYRGHTEDVAQNYNSPIEYLNDCHKKSLKVFEQLTPEELNKKCLTPAGVQVTLWKWLRAWIEHEIHHRGQIYTYLNLIGIESPPIYGLTSEQVKENSMH